MKMSKRWPAVLLLMAVLLTAVVPAAVLAEETVVATPTEVPMESVSPYRVVLTVPGGWSNSNTATVKVSITDREKIGWYKVEYRMNDGSWTDCEDFFNGTKAEIIVRENGTFTLRMTDPHGHQFEESAKVDSIDQSAPLVTAQIHTDTLAIEVQDDLSGVAGVQVNSMLFTDVKNGELSIDLDDSMNRYEKFSIRAFDYAGNFSDLITLDNPNYVKPADPTQIPTATPKPSKTPSSATEEPASTVTAVPTATATSKPNGNGLGGSLIYVYDEPEYTAAPTQAPTQAPTPEPIIQTEYITIGPGMPYQADGNSHTLDVLYSAATNKQFITIQSKNGNTFYLVIDYDKPIDEEAEMYETYFLNLVDERDLMALLSDEEKEEVPTPTPEIIYVTPQPTTVPTATVLPADAETETKPDQMTAIIALVAIIAIAGVAAVLFFKNKKGTNKPRSDNNFVLDDDDDDEDAVN